MNFTEKLNLLTTQSQIQIEKSKKVQAMLSGSLDQQDYVKFLIVLYPIVSNFCPMMAMAAGHTADKNQQIVNYLYDHILEEKGHEQLVLNDLKALKLTLHRFLNCLQCHRCKLCWLSIITLLLIFIQFVFLE